MKTKEQILEQMTDIMPYKLADEIKPYVLEAMQVHADEQLRISIVSVSLLDTVDQLINVYEDRLNRANRNRSYLEAHNNQLSIDVLDHLKAVVRHNER